MGKMQISMALLLLASPLAPLALALAGPSPHGDPPLSSAMPYPFRITDEFTQ